MFSRAKPRACRGSTIVVLSLAASIGAGNGPVPAATPRICPRTPEMAGCLSAKARREALARSRSETPRDQDDEHPAQEDAGKLSQVRRQRRGLPGWKHEV